MPRLEGTLKHYDWGSKTAIAELRGIPLSGEPEAEPVSYTHLTLPTKA